MKETQVRQTKISLKQHDYKNSHKYHMTRFIWLYFHNPINDISDQPLALEYSGFGIFFVWNFMKSIVHNTILRPVDRPL